MTIKIISALSSNYIIGSNGKIPWFIKGELKRFKHITLNHNVIMGRKTFDSIGKVSRKKNKYHHFKK
jgi:dihydrofolate reductase